MTTLAASMTTRHEATMRSECLSANSDKQDSSIANAFYMLCEQLQSLKNFRNSVKNSVALDHLQSQSHSLSGAEISGPFSSSSLPPSLVPRHFATTFMPGACAVSASPFLLRESQTSAAGHAAGLLPFLSQLAKPLADAPGPRRRVAVIGSGIAGLSSAWALSSQARVTLFEASDYFGGHTHTVDIELENQRHGVDTGFLVFNERTYPLLIELFKQLDVEVATSEMSFSVQVADQQLEWSGNNLNGLFAQRANLFRPAFWGMLGDLQKFNRLCTDLASQGSEAALAQAIGDFLDQHGFKPAFRDWYLLPMVACIWSCPTRQMLAFPISTLIRFCHNHGLLQITNRPQWYTVRGGAKRYVAKLLTRISDARLNCPVHAVRRLPGGGVEIRSARGAEVFDEVVMAGHSDQSLALLDRPSKAEQQVLGAIPYHRNRAVLHTDAQLMPRRKQAWAAWNYEHGGKQSGGEERAVCLHYWLNRLQPLPWQQPVMVSLNPVREPATPQVLAEFDYAHPVFDRAAVAAQARLPLIQGEGHIWYCGAWTRYGFHEDGLLSGLNVAQQLMARWAQEARQSR